MAPIQTLRQTPKLLRYLGLVAAAETPAEVLRAVQSYLDAWPKERIASVQRVDGGWAPFDWNQRPLRVNGVRDLRRIHDVVHCHCIFLSEAGIALTPELEELNEFFVAATEKADKFGPAALQSRTPATRTPTIPSHQYVLGNW